MYDEERALFGCNPAHLLLTYFDVREKDGTWRTLSMEESDSELILAYQNGDSRAFEALITRHVKVIYNFVYRMLQNREEADDITQEVFVKIWKNLKKYDSKRSFKTWILTIARNTTFDFFRKRKTIAFSRLDDEEAGASFADSIADPLPLAEKIFEQKELAARVEKALDTMPLLYRTVLILRHNENLTFEEIAVVIDKPINTVKSQYRRGLILLQKFILNAPQ